MSPRAGLSSGGSTKEQSMVVVVVVGSIQFFVVVGFIATCFSKPPERGENESANKIVLYDTIISLPYSVG